MAANLRVECKAKQYIREAANTRAPFRQRHEVNNLKKYLSLPRLKKNSLLCDLFRFPKEI